MATDLRKQQGTTSRTKAVRPERLEPGSRWPVVAAGIVLVVLAAVAVLVFTQEGSQPVVGPDHWATNVEGMMTDTREGGGFPQPVEPVWAGVDAGAYAEGARTSFREATSAGSGVEDPPDLMTEVREG